MYLDKDAIHSLKQELKTIIECDTKEFVNKLFTLEELRHYLYNECLELFQKYYRSIIEHPTETNQCIKCKSYYPLYLLDNEGICDDCKPMTQEQNLKEEASQKIV